MPVSAQTKNSSGDAPPSAAKRQAITRVDQLPRRTYILSKLPSEMLTAPLAELRPLGARLEADLLSDLVAYDVQNATILREIYSTLVVLSQLRGDWASVPKWTAKARALQDTVGGRLTNGVTLDLLSQQQQEKRDAAWLQAEVARRYGALPWADVQENVRSAKESLESFNPDKFLRSVKNKFDPIAKSEQLVVPGDVLQLIIGAKVQRELLTPNKSALVAAFQAVIDANEMD